MKRLKKVRQMYTLFSVGRIVLGAMLLIWPTVAAVYFLKKEKDDGKSGN